MLRTEIATIFIGFLGLAVFGQDSDKGTKTYDAGDYATALPEWRPLAEQGIAVAQFNLGVMYANGSGVLKEILMAHMWFNIAAANGDEKASVYRDVAKDDLTREQIAEATQWARICMASDHEDCE